MTESSSAYIQMMAKQPKVVRVPSCKRGSAELYSQVHVQKLEGPYPKLVSASVPHLQPVGLTKGREKWAGHRAAHPFSLWRLTYLSTHELFVVSPWGWGVGREGWDSGQSLVIAVASSVLSRLADARSELLSRVCLQGLGKAPPASPLPS